MIELKFKLWLEARGGVPRAATGTAVDYSIGRSIGTDHRYRMGPASVFYTHIPPWYDRFLSWVITGIGGVFGKAMAETGLQPLPPSSSFLPTPQDMEDPENLDVTIQLETDGQQNEMTLRQQALEYVKQHPHIASSIKHRILGNPQPNPVEERQFVIPGKPAMYEATFRFPKGPAFSPEGVAELQRQTSGTHQIQERLLDMVNKLYPNKNEADAVAKYIKNLVIRHDNQTLQQLASMSRSPRQLKVHFQNHVDFERAKIIEELEDQIRSSGASENVASAAVHSLHLASPKQLQQMAQSDYTPEQLVNFLARGTEDES